MTNVAKPVAILASEAPARIKPSNYPEPFASRMTGREKRPLGDLFGLMNFGVNLTRLAPNAVSALRHAHSKQDEFIYILQGVDGRWQVAVCSQRRCPLRVSHVAGRASPSNVS